MSSNLQDSIHATVGRVLSDPDFAEQVKRDGMAALQAGPDSSEWEAYFNHFASTPGELSTLGAANASSCTCNSATWTTLSTIVTPVPTCCGATTTTTTSGG